MLIDFFNIRHIIQADMVLSIVFSLITVLGIVITSLVKPNVKIGKFTLNFYWLIALLGAVLILLTGTISLQEMWEGLTNNFSINPIKILLLFLSMSLISIFLDELGLFSFLANWVMKRTKNKQIVIFIVFYILVSLLTMFTSNDIVILTLTPFIICFCKNGKISPIPYLVSEFIAANTWSMMFVIGNPTNIYLAQSYNIGFVDYFLKMALPTLVSGIVEFGALLLIFNKTLKEPIIKQEIELEKLNKPLVIIGVIILAICTIMLVISSYIDLPMYIISVISLGVLVVAVLIYCLIAKHKPIELGKSLIRTPIELVPFVIGMFVLVLALNKHGITASICEAFGTKGTTFSYGYSSLLAANLINNIPMSVIYSSILSGLSGEALVNGIYASIVGSNLGAFITPIGALAGIMWMNILKSHGIKYSFVDFIKFGLPIGILVSNVALLMLFLLSL